MKTIVYERFGPPEVLQLREIEKPVPGDREVLIRIQATTVELEDPMMRRSPGINGIFKPKRSVLGMEFAGVIEVTGRNVAGFRVGDEVYGNTGMKMGTCAEYLCLPEDSALALKPINISYEEAAAITNGSLTALPFLRDKADIQNGQTILINGASGTVGSAALQLAKYYGARVTAVCGTRNVDKVHTLGADRVIDYTKEDFAETGDTWDIIFDVAGKTSYGRCKKLLNRDGIYLATLPTPSILFHMMRSKIFGGKKVYFSATGLRSPEKKREDLEFIKSIVEEGKLKPNIDRTWPLEEIIHAHRYMEEGRKSGTVVIIM